KLGFECMPSKTNFLFARHPLMEGAALYQALRERGVLVRHFDQPRIRDYNRITVGTREQMQILLGILEEML
ncbi:MAG: aminotransferase class I/II-fold pyridoxal phosphate-dependent enzyme, partial [Clostridiales bacterium]|nr:aminotransferase class I/II-fold pyridoxal phosphate-dependent enzyme [Clostridiales bacterium]